MSLSNPLSVSKDRTSSGALAIGRSVQRSLLRYELGKLDDVTQWPCCTHGPETTFIRFFAKLYGKGGGGGGGRGGAGGRGAGGGGGGGAGGNGSPSEVQVQLSAVTAQDAQPRPLAHGSWWPPRASKRHGTARPLRGSPPPYDGCLP